MKISLMQPNYIPWRGYFSLIKSADFFVFYDNVQYTKKDWRNRNYINGINGLVRLTVPVIATSSSLLNEVIIDNSSGWSEKHVTSLEINYCKAKFFKQFFPLLCDNIYSKPWTKLNDLNVSAIALICDILKIKTKKVKASDFPFVGSKSGEKIIKFCKHFGCSTLINGPKSKNYLDLNMFDSNGIAVCFIDYKLPEYEVPKRVSYTANCSVLDLLFNVGPDSWRYV